MNHRQRKILHAIFAHPINANLGMHEIVSVLGNMGAEISEAKKGKVHVRMNGHEVNFEPVHHSLPKDMVVQVRKFIELCGVDSAVDYPL